MHANELQVHFLCYWYNRLWFTGRCHSPASSVSEVITVWRLRPIILWHRPFLCSSVTCWWKRTMRYMLVIAVVGALFLAVTALPHGRCKYLTQWWTIFCHLVSQSVCRMSFFVVSERHVMSSAVSSRDGRDLSYTVFCLVIPSETYVSMILSED